MPKTLATFGALAALPPTTAFAQLNLRGGRPVLDFDPAAAEGALLSGIMPAHYSGGPIKLVLLWTAEGNSGAVRWEGAFERHPIGDAAAGTIDLDLEAFGATTPATATAPTTPGQLVRTELTLVAAPLPGEAFRVRVRRIAADAADTLATDAQLLAAELLEA